MEGDSAIRNSHKGEIREGRKLLLGRIMVGTSIGVDLWMYMRRVANETEQT